MSSGLEVRLRLPLDRFDLEVEFEAGARWTALFGASGAGKSSLLRAIAGLEPRARGVVRLDGETWLDSAAGVNLATEARGVGYVPQDGLLFPHLTVEGNLRAGAERARRRGWDLAETFDRVVALLRLEELLGRAPETLSGGERQRVALGRAICSGPRLLLLDEPLAALDLRLRRALLPLLRRIRDELEQPWLLVSHQPVEVQALCEEAVALDRGRVTARGPVGEVLTDPRVLPIEEEGFENVVAGTVGEPRDGMTAVGLGGGFEGPVELLVPAAQTAPGEELLVGIPSRDILLAAERPRGISARNVLPARVTSVTEAGDRFVVRVRCGDDLPELAADVTPDARRDLDLAPGREVHLILKTHACRLYE